MEFGQFCKDPINTDEDGGVNLLKCLCMSLSDEEGKTLVKRHTVLMNHYLNLRINGIKSVDLPYLMNPLEFFSENSTDEPQYFTLVTQCLNLLLKPILLHKSSDACSAVNNFKYFFSALGNSLHISEDTNIESAILDVILFLLTHKEKRREEVSLEIRLEAVETSFLAETLVAFMFFITEELYLPLLEIMYQLSMQPSIAKFFQSLKCMDFWIRKVSIKNVLSIREASIKETTSNLLWSIMRSPNTLDDEPTLNSESLSIVRGWLRREVLFGQTYERNNIAALLLQFLTSIPKLEISRSGIIQDIGLLAFASEFGTGNTWANKMHFRPTRDDLDFKKILIAILLILKEDLITKMVLLENRAINAMAYILNFRNCNTALKWSECHQLELVNYCLYALPIFSKQFKQEYTRSGATTRILELIEYYTYKQQKLRLVKNCCICLHLLISEGISLNHFIEMNVTQVLINLIFHSLQNFTLNLLVQTIITYCFCAITNLIQDSKKMKELLETDLQKLYTLISSRIEKPAETDTMFSDSFLIASLDFIWQCTFLNEKLKDLFFDNLGVYSLFNIMEDASFVVQTLCLSILSEICVDPKSIPQIVTWRGKEGNNNFFKFICGLWRKQEKMKGVLRDEYGCIEDIEHSLMGERQKIEAKSECDDISASPSLVDMISCVRPKIAIAVDLITRRHSEKVKLASSVYNVPFDSGISPEDKITLQIIQCFEELKLGEILWEVQRAVDKVGVKLLPLDIEVLHQLIMRLAGLASKVQRGQRSILKAMRNKELDEEQKVYKAIKEHKLTTAFSALIAKDSYLTISNKLYRKWKHEKYQKILDEIEVLYADKKYRNFHKTFYHPRNFIVVKTGRDAHIISIKRKKESSRISFYNEVNLDEQHSDNELSKPEQ